MYIKYKDLCNFNLDYFIRDLSNKDNNYYFNCDYLNGRYYIYGSKVITLLELVYEYLPFNTSNGYKVDEILDHKHLFSRSKGKKLTKEELDQLAYLYNELRK